jgi:hypothetical protein
MICDIGRLLPQLARRTLRETFEHSVKEEFLEDIEIANVTPVAGTRSQPISNRQSGLWHGNLEDENAPAPNTDGAISRRPTAIANQPIVASRMRQIVEVASTFHSRERTCKCLKQPATLHQKHEIP